MKLGVLLLKAMLLHLKKIGDESLNLHPHELTSLENLENLFVLLAKLEEYHILK